MVHLRTEDLVRFDARVSASEVLLQQQGAQADTQAQGAREFGDGGHPDSHVDWLWHAPMRDRDERTDALLERYLDINPDEVDRECKALIVFARSQQDPGAGANGAGDEAPPEQGPRKRRNGARTSNLLEPRIRRERRPETPAQPANNRPSTAQGPTAGGGKKVPPRRADESWFYS